MTSRLDRLVARKLVVRRPDDDDGRLVRVRLTAAGRRRIDGALTALLGSERELVSALADAKRERLAAGLRELLAAAVSQS
jgi:DNA-binding MarR family transcriptional regulator